MLIGAIFLTSPKLKKDYLQIDKTTFGLFSSSPSLLFTGSLSLPPLHPIALSPSLLIRCHIHHKLHENIKSMAKSRPV
jgi:hypothetical protein